MALYFFLKMNTCIVYLLLERVYFLHYDKIEKRQAPVINLINYLFYYFNLFDSDQ